MNKRQPFFVLLAFVLASSIGFAAVISVSVSLTPDQQVQQASIGNRAGSLTSAVEDGVNMLRGTSADGFMRGIFSLTAAWRNAAQEQHQQDLIFYDQSELTKELRFAQPAPGTSTIIVDITTQLISVWALDSDGVKYFPVGDEVAFFTDPFPPYLTGKLAGTFSYDEPILFSVMQSTKMHRATVRQGNQRIIANLKKVFEHPAPLSDRLDIRVQGNIVAQPILGAGTSAFTGKLSDAEVVIFGGSLGSARVERVAPDEVQVFPD